MRTPSRHRPFAAILPVWLGAIVMLLGSGAASAQVLDKQKLLDAQTFWDNRDWDWYKANIPFFDSPDADINTTYYYRWELVTKHLTYGSPDAGYVYTEFIDRPFWSGRYGSISCPAGHQLYEVRWLADSRLSWDYARYWFRTEGAQPRRYSTWLGDAVWAVHEVRPNEALVKDLLPDLVKNYEGWEREHFVPEVGLFWQTGHDDGMEYNINSRQTQDLVRGAPGYRPTLNSYLWADARAIERVARLAGDEATAKAYAAKAAGLKENLQKKLWDPKRDFFFHMYKQDEARDGFTVRAMTLTEQTGRFAGSGFGREEIGFVPWQFNLPDGGYESAWQFLMKPERFFSAFGPTTVERQDPMFHLSPTCCWWSGQSWPYATTQTLAAMGSLLRDYPQQKQVTRDDYFKLLRTYSLTHRKDGRPYIAEAANPDTGSWKGHDTPGHSNHYFHSGYTDLIVTGLAGLRPRADDTIEVNPLAPDAWDYFGLDDVAYRGRRVSILWDRKGNRYGRGPGLHLLAEGKELASAPTLTKLTAELPALALARDQAKAPTETVPVNFAVNNDGTYYPRVSASFTADRTSVAKIIDGNYWYHLDPPNRWTAKGSTSASDWVAIDFGTKRPIHTIKLYLLDDGERVTAPAKYDLDFWDGNKWAPVPGQQRNPETPTGHRANVVRFPELQTQKVRAVFTHGLRGQTGLTELEAWGDARLPVGPAPAPAGNLAFNPGDKPFPKASASFTSRFDKVSAANDGVVSFSPEPHNRWTSYESPNPTDWLEIDFGPQERRVARVELAIYDDRGGVQPPADYSVQLWTGSAWRDAAGQKKDPARPTGGQFNEVRFEPANTSKLRVLLTHAGKARSGISEILVWPE